MERAYTATLDSRAMCFSDAFRVMLKISVTISGKPHHHSFTWRFTLHFYGRSIFTGLTGANSVRR